MTTIPSTIPDPFVWIDGGIVRRLATAAVSYEMIREAFLLHAVRDFDQPPKPYVRPGGREEEWKRGRLIVMPAYLGGSIRALGAKLITGFPANVLQGRPRASALVVLFSPDDGRPLAILDGTDISIRRTAAVASVCVDYLAPRRALQVAILGAGPVASECVVNLLLSRARDIAGFIIHDPIEARVDELIRRVAPQTEIPIVAATDPSCCVAGADVVIAATTGAREYIDLKWLLPDCLSIALSLDDFKPEVLLEAGKLICDDFDQCAREDKVFHRLVSAGAINRASIYAELGEIVAGHKSGREGNERIHVNAMGLAIEDLALAARIYELAYPILEETKK